MSWYIRPSIDGKVVEDRWTLGSNKLFPIDGNKVVTNPNHDILFSRGYLPEVIPLIGHGFERGELEIGVESATYKVVSSAPPLKDRPFINSQITQIKDYYIKQVSTWRTNADMAIPGSLTDVAANFGLQVLRKFETILADLEATPDEDLPSFDYLSIWDDTTDFDQLVSATVTEWRMFMDSIPWNKHLW